MHGRCGGAGEGVVLTGDVLVCVVGLGTSGSGAAIVVKLAASLSNWQTVLQWRMRPGFESPRVPAESTLRGAQRVRS